jgi:hypothetical protein
MVTIESIKRAIRTKLTSGKDTAYMLNYLTLWIKEEKVRKDLINHIIEQRVFIQWAVAFLSIVVLLVQLVLYKVNYDLLSVISNLIYVLAYAVVNSVLLFRFKAGLRWTSCVVMLCQSILFVYAASPYGKMLSSKTTLEMIYLQN